ncbi:MAG TPA: exodeoxyribonuclease VII small subunit [Candidatus Baltobacteraceae bacterium]|nr:exodeoxyribonuclease VII small subunit [Candidatus Baltobacteraceae bacterium]
MTTAQADSFEKSLARLEEIVQRLERPDVSLDESVRLYEEGKRLSKLCEELLEQAQKRIDRVNGANGTDASAPPSVSRAINDNAELEMPF